MRRALIQLIVPHETKRNRGHGLSHEALFLYATFVFLVQFGISFIGLRFPGVLGFASDITIDEVVERTNQKRVENNLPPLEYSEKLSQAALDKAGYMFEKDFWAHVAPDGTTPWKFILNRGYRYLYAGENLAKDFQNSADVVTAWMSSKAGHRENILGAHYREIGVAVVNGTLGGFKTTLVVQMFGSLSTLGVAEARPAQPQSGPRPLTVLQEEILPKPALTPGVRPSIAPSLSLPAVEKPLVPVLDVLTLVKSVSYTIGFFLLALFLVDGFVVYKKGLVRVSGHNGAHIMVLLLILGSTWFLSAGAIR